MKSPAEEGLYLGTMLRYLYLSISFSATLCLNVTSFQREILYFTFVKSDLPETNQCLGPFVNSQMSMRDISSSNFSDGLI